MISQLKRIGRAIIPHSLFKALQPYYHGFVAYAAHLYFGRPSRSMIVIGVTGTAGKSTTINALVHILHSAGHNPGFVTTTNFYNGKDHGLNKHGMSMPGGWMLQRELAEMKRNGCTHAVVECTSEGLAQNRHAGVWFDAALLTNLSPAHIDAHGSYEAYKAAKRRLFTALDTAPHKTVRGVPVKKIRGVNVDSDSYEMFISPGSASRTFGITVRETGGKDDRRPTGIDEMYTATVGQTEPSIDMTVNGTGVSTPLPGLFNAYNALMAIGCAVEYGVPLAVAAEAMNTFRGVPGRMERIPNERGFTVIVDYACEPKPLESALESVSKLPHKRLIHVFGATGGHRDANKGFQFGALSSRFADTVIITNDDVYDSDPRSIVRNIRAGIESVPREQWRITDVRNIYDRHTAIKEAVRIAEPGDLVFITGKGSEQFLVLPGNKRVAWDDRAAVLDALTTLSQ